MKSILIMALLSLTSSVYAGGNTKTAKEISRLLTSRIANLGIFEYVLTETEFRKFMDVATRHINRYNRKLSTEDGKELRDQLVDLYLDSKVDDDSNSIDHLNFSNKALEDLSRERLVGLLEQDNIDAVKLFRFSSELQDIENLLSLGDIPRDAITNKAKALVDTQFSKEDSDGSKSLIEADNYRSWEHDSYLQQLKLLVEYGADDSRVEHILQIAEVAEGRKRKKARRWKRLRNAVGLYLASQIVIPLGFYVTFSTRNAEVQAKHFVEERITKGAAEKLVIYDRDGDGIQEIGVIRERPKWKFWGSDDVHKVAPLSVNRTFPFHFADGAVAADGWWGLLNSDIVPDIFTAKKLDRDEVSAVSSAGKISGEVRIKTERGTLVGQGVVKLIDNDSGEEFYAVLVEERHLTAVVVPEDEPYFIFVSAAEFAAGKDLAQRATK